MKYTFQIPRSRMAVVQSADPQLLNIPVPNTIVKDIILHALVVRIAYTDGHTEEFYTKLQSNGTLEIDIPQDRLDLLDNVVIGPKIQQFIDWLIQRTETTPTIITVTESGTLVVGGSFTTILIDASSGPIDLTLPAPSPINIINIKRIDGSIYGVRILPPSGTIDGDGYLDINIQNESYQLAADSTNYYII